MAREFPDTHAGWSASVRPLREFYTGDIGQLLWVLQGAALILLLIAASNVASLVLVRANGRQRETAIRLALGAGRMTLLRMHLAEGLDARSRRWCPRAAVRVVGRAHAAGPSRRTPAIACERRGSRDSSTPASCWPRRLLR